MTHYQEYKHPLLKDEDRFNEYIVEDKSIDYYTKIEKRINWASVFLIIISILIEWVFIGIGDDPNPMVAFAVIPMGILYCLGLISSGILFWYSYEEKIKTKTITLINFIIFLGIPLLGFL